MSFCRSVAAAAFSAALLVGTGVTLTNLTPAAYAQQVAVAEVRGTVTDPAGQAIPGADVKMIETARGQVHTTKTDVYGQFALPNLPIGPYRLEVTVQGFKTYV